MNDHSGVSPQTSSKATVALACSIVSLLLPYVWFILAIVAIVMGNSARKEIAHAAGALTGEGRAKASVIIGWISLVLGLIFTITLETLR